MLMMCPDFSVSFESLFEEFPAATPWGCLDKGMGKKKNRKFLFKNQVRK